MAKFKVFERAKYIGPVTRNGFGAGDQVEIDSIHEVAPWDSNGSMLLVSSTMHPGQTIYGVTWLRDSARGGYIPECELEKLLPKHQDSDLKTADPHFINHQLPHWLHQEEKKHERA